MIDLHMHTTCSDGLDHPNMLLQKAEEKGLELISITDHNNALAYENINRNIFSGGIIQGVEIATSFEGHIIEILAYGIDIDIINEWYRNFYSDENLAYNEEELFKRILNILDNLGVKYTDGLRIPNIEKGISKKTIYYDIIKYKENKKKLPENTFGSYKKFFRQGLANPESFLFCSEGDFYPNLEDVIYLIKKAGGLAFFAHLFEYQVTDHFEFLNRLLKTVKIDGLECYHSVYTNDNIKNMIEYANKNNYYISGGSDYHGKPHRNVELGVGKGQLEIPKSIIDDWIHKVDLI